jgi:hypothetical protein
MSVEAINVAELRKTLLAIDNCQGHAIVKDDATGETLYDEPCTIQVMCDECIGRLAGLLEWAEDFEEETKQLELPLRS